MGRAGGARAWPGQGCPRWAHEPPAREGRRGPQHWGFTAQHSTAGCCLSPPHLGAVLSLSGCPWALRALLAHSTVTLGHLGLQLPLRARKEGSGTPCCKICCSPFSFESNLMRYCSAAAGNKGFKSYFKGKEVFSRKEVPTPLCYLPVLQQETFPEPPGTQGRLFALCLVHRQSCQLPY